MGAAEPFAKKKRLQVRRGAVDNSLETPPRDVKIDRLGRPDKRLAPELLSMLDDPGACRLKEGIVNV